MNILKVHILLLSVLFILFFSKTVSGLNEETHELINERVAEITLLNGFSLNDYLINQLDLKNGINEEFNNKEVKRWLELGGTYEDSPPWRIPYLRSLNHFHDPIADMGFNVNGETNLLEIIDNYSIFRYYYPILNLIGNIDIKSSIDWGLLPKETQYFGYYSWNDVRDYYYKALTSSDQNARNDNFEETFKGLGQLMHLVQDASSPAHTRNDPHGSQKPEKNYEAWGKDNISTGDISGYAPKFFDGTKNSMASFIDTDQYNGTNPDITAGTDIGLSEYTNANFFSEDTNAFESTSYTYPQVPDDPMSDPTHIENRNYENQYGDDYPRQYYKKDSDGETNNNTGYLLSALDYLEYYRKSLNPLGIRKLIVPLLDYHVYGAYADLLLPRAIGYSAGLLNYFFRGEIEIIQVPNSNNIKIKNNSSEDMDGIFTLYYDATDGNRYPVSDGSWFLSLQPVNTTGDTSDELSFTEPTDFAEGKEYILVFLGTLGSESNAVVGKFFQGDVFDHFDDNELDPIWQISFSDTAGWNYSEAGTLLTVTDISSTVLNTDDGGTWGRVFLSQPAPALDNFEADFHFRWDSEGQVQAMQNLIVRIYDENEGLIAGGGYSDAWVGFAGAKSGSAGGSSFNTGSGSLILSGSAAIKITRENNFVRFYWDSQEMVSGTSFGKVGRVEIEFSHYAFDNWGWISFFGNESVDLISLRPLSLP